jgi:hypothetical protein
MQAILDTIIDKLGRVNPPLPSSPSLSAASIVWVQIRIEWQVEVGVICV